MPMTREKQERLSEDIHLLGDILGIAHATEHFCHRADHRTLVDFDNFFKSVDIALLDLHHQADVIIIRLSFVIGLGLS